MSNVISLVDEERLLGDWPRRLLHVPTMISYQWQPGNVYGPATSPRYCAISYTWGRWRLKDHQRPDVYAIKISNILWKIPRIDPVHFQKDAFEIVVRRATQPTSWILPQRLKPELYEQVDFVWLDVACIDQRPGEPRSAAEVGRQAEIFKNAHGVYVWLNNFSQSKLQSLLTQLRHLPHKFEDARKGRAAQSAESIADQVYSSLKELAADPWFSSLWTLQEAFLRPDAVFLSSDGHPVQVDDQYCALYDLISLYEDSDLDGLRAQGRQLTPAFTQLFQLAQRLGIPSLASTHPVSALAASSSRTTTREEDRVYGIQQIFNFRLGATNVKAVPGRQFSRQELEIELGQSLLAAYPVHSQTHIFTKPVKYEHGWRMNQDSVVPPTVMSSGGPGDPYDHTLSNDLRDFPEYIVSDCEQYLREYSAPRCSLSTQQAQGITYGIFDGLLSPFETLITRFKDFQNKYWGEAAKQLNVFLDASHSTSLAGCPEELRGGFFSITDKGRQRSLSEWLCRQFAPADLQVLLLGPIINSQFGSCMYALLLTRINVITAQAQTQGLPSSASSTGSSSCWRRRGFCEWDIATLTMGGEDLEGSEFLAGKTPEWVRERGSFG